VHLARVENREWNVFQTINQVRPDDVKDRCNLVENPDTAEHFVPEV
jgi:hypothetical protein